MAIRKIRTDKDPCLYKVCRDVTDFNEKLNTLLDDMLETMYDANGVGLAAPQVGVLKRIVVIDVTPEGDNPLVLINPRIVEQSGEQTGYEGCLSVPGKSGKVTRANYVKCLAVNEHMEPIEIEGTELLARAILHECDHLDGKLYVDLVEDGLVDNSADDYDDE